MHSNKKLDSIVHLFFCTIRQISRHMTHQIRPSARFKSAIYRRFMNTLEECQETHPLAGIDRLSHSIVLRETATEY